MSEWWYPDPTDPFKGPNWVPVDLVASRLSEVILMREGGGVRRIHRPGEMTVVVGDVKILIAEGQSRYVRLMRPEDEAVIE